MKNLLFVCLIAFAQVAFAQSFGDDSVSNMIAIIVVVVAFFIFLRISAKKDFGDLGAGDSKFAKFAKSKKQVAEEADLLLVLDTETTGLENDDEICEIAIIKGNGECVLNTLIKPKKIIPAAATGVHGITNEMVANAPTWAEVHDLFCKLIDGKMLMAYNSEFDERLLRQTMIYAGKIDMPDMKFQCAMKLYTKYCGDRKWRKLGVAAEGCGVTVANAHRALGDCQMTLGVIKHLESRGFGPRWVKKKK